MKADRPSSKETGKDPGTPSPEQANPAPKSQGVNLLDLFKQVLGNISGGRVLDVATGEGGFIELLARQLKNYSAIIGIDIDERVLATASSSRNQENIRFIQWTGSSLTRTR